MTRRLRVALLFLALLCSIAEAAAQEVPTRKAYPDTADDLGSAIEDIIASLGNKNEQLAEALVKNFTFPGYEAWFHNVFGREEGARLASKYARIKDQSVPSLPGAFAQTAKKKNRRISVLRLEKAYGRSGYDNCRHLSD